MVSIFLACILVLIFVLVLWCGVYLYRFGFCEGARFSKTDKREATDEKLEIDKSDSFAEELDEEFRRLMSYTGEEDYEDGLEEDIDE